MENKIIYQKMGKECIDQYALAQRYYGILSVLNDLALTERETQLVAYTAIKGNISLANVRDEFCKRYNSSGATIDNIVSKMKRLGVMVKENGRVKVNPSIALDFEKDLILQVNLRHGQSKVS